MGHEAAVVGVQPHHVGHRAQCHQRQQAVKLGLGAVGKAAALAQLGAQRQQHIKHDADAGDGLAGKVAAGLVGVNDHIGRGQQGLAVQHCRQVVVGHQHLQAKRARRGHTVDAANAVVHRDQHVGAAGLDPLSNGGCEAVAIHHPVGYQIVHMACPQQAQAAHCYSAGRSAIAVVIGHDAKAQVGGDGVGQQGGRSRTAHQVGRWQQMGQGIVQLQWRLHAASGIQLRQQRMHAGLLQGPDAAGWNISCYKFHSFSIRLDKGWGRILFIIFCQKAWG